jgi:sulfoacetaldehyde acetyltransferase
MTKMTTEEAFVKVLQRHGIEHAFGIIGSAMMPVSDLFPTAGITFWDCAHECNAGMMADGFTRASGKMSMMIAQNGPGITNFVTPVKTAYWNHTPLLLVTPQAANKTIGQGGFQEIPQMALFEDMVCYQEEVRDPTRIAEVLNRVIEQAWRGSAPAQINVPRDYWTQVVDGGETSVRSRVPGDPEWRRRGAFGWYSGVRETGRKTQRAGLLRLSAQRRVPGLASAFGRPTRL